MVPAAFGTSRAAGTVAMKKLPPELPSLTVTSAPGSPSAASVDGMNALSIKRSLPGPRRVRTSRRRSNAEVHAIT